MSSDTHPGSEEARIGTDALRTRFPDSLQFIFHANIESLGSPIVRL